MNMLDPRVKRTRQLLTDALLDLLQTRTFSQITVQDITRQAEVNRATFYAHFLDKLDLLGYMVRQMFQAQLDHRLPASPPLTPTTLQVLVIVTADFLGDFAVHCAIAAFNPDQILMTTQMQTHLTELLREWGKDQDMPEFAARFASWAIIGSVLHWVNDGRKITVQTLTEQILDLLLPGLSPYLEAEPLHQGS